MGERPTFCVSSLWPLMPYPWTFPPSDGDIPNGEFCHKPATSADLPFVELGRNESSLVAIYARPPRKSDRA